MATDWLSYQNQNATRNQPLAPKLVEAMSFLPSMGVSMKVHSGGQDSSGPNRVGSTRHDHGNAGDVDFYQNGRKLDWNKASDLPILSSIVYQAKANGVTGIGAGDDYMGAGRFHIGFGNPGVWGAGGSSKNAPSWLRDAYYGTAASGPIMSYAPQQQPASTPATRAIGTATQGAQPQGFFGALASLVPQNISMPQMTPGMQSAAAGALLGTPGGRNMISRAIQGMNIGAAPQVTQGHTGMGTLATAVNSRGANPVTLTGRNNSSSSGAHGNMNMDVYRANAATLGGRNFNQQSINDALSRGKTLYKLA